MNDIVSQLDEKINEYPGELSGFLLMFLSLFFYIVGIIYFAFIGFHKLTILIISIGIGLQIFIPIGGVIEICFSGKGTVEEGVKNAFKGAGSICWCCFCNY